MNNRYQAKGKLIFTTTNDGLTCYEEVKPEYLSETEWDKIKKEIYNFPIYDLMSGEEFLTYVRSGFFNDYDGSLSEIFVNSHVTNLGLNENGICQGNLLINGDLFQSICEEFKVEVNWANK